MPLELDPRDAPTIQHADEATTADPPKNASRSGAVFGSDKYRLGRSLGRGGMGEVCAAHDEVIGREVAIKRMLQDQPSPEREARFLREARIQGRLDHPSIPPVYELGYDRDDQPYLVMKRLTGKTLAEILAGPYTRERLLRAFVDVGVLLHSPAIAATQVPIVAGFAFYTVIGIGFVAMVSSRYARAQRRMDVELHVHAWRMRQLVPDAE